MKKLILLKMEKIMAGDATKEIIHLICPAAIILSIFSRYGNMLMVQSALLPAVMFTEEPMFPNWKVNTFMEIFAQAKYGLLSMMELILQLINYY